MPNYIFTINQSQIQTIKRLLADMQDSCIHNEDKYLSNKVLENTVLICRMLDRLEVSEQ